jgi:hypothetical protein
VTLVNVSSAYQPLLQLISHDYFLVSLQGKIAVYIIPAYGLPDSVFACNKLRVPKQGSACHLCLICVHTLLLHWAWHLDELMRSS